MHTPEWLWLSTGIRAVDHCVEGICSREAHPYADAQALKGLSMLAQALPRVKADAGDLDARMDCQIGTWLSMGPLASRRADGRQPRHRLRARRRVRRAARLHLLRDAAVGDALEQAGQCRAAGAGRRPRWGIRARMPATCSTRFIRGLGMPRSLREVKIGPEHFDRIASRRDGDAMGAAQPAQDRGSGAGARDS